jgi:hypothetical protein
VQELKTHGAGNLFVKTHPKSKNLWVDAPQNPEKDVAESVAVYDLNDLTKKPELINVAKLSGPAREQGDQARRAARVQRRPARGVDLAVGRQDRAFGHRRVWTTRPAR